MDQQQACGESTEGINEWKKRAPYRIHEPNEKFPVRYDANCHCGKVKYQLSRQEPLGSKLCHCTTCQTQHGIARRLIPNVMLQLYHLIRNPFIDLDGIGLTLLQPHPFNGQQYSTRKTLTLWMGIITWSGTIRPKRPQNTSCHVRCGARIATVRSWMRAGI